MSTPEAWNSGQHRHRLLRQFMSTGSCSIQAWKSESSTSIASSTSTLVSFYYRPLSIQPQPQPLTSFSSGDIEALLSGNKYIKQLIPAVVNLVYKKILQYDITSRAFHTRTTVDETEPEEGYLSEDTPKIQRRKLFLRWYLTRLCQDPTTMEFWRYLNKVG